MNSKYKKPLDIKHEKALNTLRFPDRGIPHKAQSQGRWDEGVRLRKSRTDAAQNSTH